MTHMNLDLRSGVFEGREPLSVRTLGELAPIFADSDSVKGASQTIVYRIYGESVEAEGPARLLYATTVLEPGQVSGEYFMTRGHFHTLPDRGEFMLTLEGEGALILMTRDRETWLEPMHRRTVHDIDGRHAHRVSNTGSVPLVFLVVWMSDCGHDYESIRAEGFSKRLMSSPDGPILA
jgi:glucose-6-phosphate isomerase, archaeal